MSDQRILDNKTRSRLIEAFRCAWHALDDDETGHVQSADYNSLIDTLITDVQRMTTKTNAIEAHGFGCPHDGDPLPSDENCAYCCQHGWVESAQGMPCPQCSVSTLAPICTRCGHDDVWHDTHCLYRDADRVCQCNGFRDLPSFETLDRWGTNIDLEHVRRSEGRWLSYRDVSELATRYEQRLDQLEADNKTLAARVRELDARCGCINGGPGIGIDTECDEHRQLRQERDQLQADMRAAFKNGGCTAVLDFKDYDDVREGWLWRDRIYNSVDEAFAIYKRMREQR